jgi:hypothetical protein
MDLDWRNFLGAVALSAMVLALTFVPLSGGQTSMPYDPWADINDDGRIDIRDIGYICRLFGTYGDPAKNVSVSGYGFKVLRYLLLSIPAKQGGKLTIQTAGYKTVTLHFNPVFWNPVFRNETLVGAIYWGDNVTVAIGFSVGMTYEFLDKFNTKTTFKSCFYDTPEWYMGTPALFTRTYTVRGEELIIGYFNPTDQGQMLSITVYLTA